MRALIASLAVVLYLNTPLLALENPKDVQQVATNSINLPKILNSGYTSKDIVISDKEIIARRGCCSWHGGVCGCANGRVVCCDGTYSPSCTCHHDDKTNISNNRQ